MTANSSFRMGDSILTADSGQIGLASEQLFQRDAEDDKPQRQLDRLVLRLRVNG